MNYKLDHNRNLSARSGVSRLNKQIQKTYKLEQRVIREQKKAYNKQREADMAFFKQTYGESWRQPYQTFLKQKQVNK